jgi:PAS domain S-box-containing protein
MTISDGASRPPLDTLAAGWPADLRPTTPGAVQAADLTEGVPLEQAIAGGTPQSVGSWRFYFADERWEWSPEVERIHGYEPGTVTPTTRLVLSHKHPDDLGHVAATLDDIRRTHRPFSTRHRIIDVHGQTREVVVIGEGLQDQGGEVVGTQGFYLDVTPSLAQQQESISRAVAAISDGRSLIDQVRGILVLVYRIDADAAFGVLKWRSQVTNTKLRAFAEQLMSDIGELEYDGQLPRRTTFDQLLLTAHQRVTK